MSQAQAADGKRKSGGGEALDPNGSDPPPPLKSYSTNFSFGAARLSSGNGGKSVPASATEESSSFSFRHEADNTNTNMNMNSNATSVSAQKRSGELSSSSSGDSPMFDVARPVRKSGEISISRVSVSSGASFSGEIPRASSSSGEIVDGFRAQRRIGETPRSSGSSNGEDRGGGGAASSRKSGEIYHGNSSGGSSSGGSPTPEIFNRGRKAGEGGSNSSAGSSDGGSPTGESLWAGKGGVALNTGMVTGGSFSSFNAGVSGDGSVTKKPAGGDTKAVANGALEINGVRLNGHPAPSSRFLVGAASAGEARGRSSNLAGNVTGKSQGLRSVRGGNAEDLKAAGNVEYKKGNFGMALALYDSAIAMCPDQAAFRCNRAAALAGVGRLGEAVVESEVAVKLDPSFARAQQRLVSLHIRLGQLEEARKYLRMAGQQNDVGDAHRVSTIEKRLNHCFEARKLKDWASVIKECDAAIVAGADYSLQIFVHKAEALLKLQRLEDADAVLAAARRVEDASPKLTRQALGTNLLVLRAQADMAQGRFEEAVTVAERAVRLEPKNFEVAALLRKARTVSKARAAGNEYFKGAKFFEACAAYTEGLELDPANAVLFCNRAASRSKLGQWEKTLEDCNAALQVQPNYMKALLRRAHSYSKLERWEDAARDYEAIRREHPGDVEVAQALFDAQLALKKSRGEEISRTRFGGGVEEVTRNDQFREAISCPGLSVVEFTTRWSDRCRQFSGFIEELCRRYPSVNFSKVDVDDSPYLAQLESISSVPTIKIFRNGVNVKELLGPSQQGLEQAVKQCGI